MDSKLIAELTQIAAEVEALAAISTALHGADVPADYITTIFSICADHIQTRAARIIDMIDMQT